MHPWWERADDATSEKTADECKQASGQELSAEEDRLRGNLVRAAKKRGPETWKKFRVRKPLTRSTPSEASVATCWAPSWEMVKGQEDVWGSLGG